MSLRRRLLAVAALAALSACTTVGPNYHTPEAAKINSPQAKGRFLESASPAVSIAPVPDDWWRLYDDPVLNGLIQKALTANTDLRVAAANLERARAGVSAAKALREPTATVSANGGPTQLSSEAYLVPSQVPEYTLAEAGVSISYDLDVVGRLRRVVEAAKADAQASAAALDLARVAVAADTASAYVDACAAGHELDTVRRIADLQQRYLDITNRLIAAGKSSELDATRARALHDRSLAEEPPLEARRRSALYRLAALTGETPSGFPQSVESCAQVPRLGQPVPVGDGAALLKRRPDVREAERVLAAATARIGVATADLYPDVTLGAAFGSDGLLADLGQMKANYWDLGPGISWTFPNRGTRARIQAAGAGAEGALANFDGVVLKALRETETALAVYVHDLDRNAELRAARDEAVRAAGEADALQRAGRSPYLTGLDAQRTLAAAESALAVSDNQIAADQVKLFLALGGLAQRAAGAADACDALIRP